MYAGIDHERPLAVTAMATELVYWSESCQSPAGRRSERSVRQALVV